MRLILASQSPARFSTLNRAGLSPEVIVSGADEDSITADTADVLVQRLAQLKGHAVQATLPSDTDAVLLACDTMLEFDDRPQGKPGSPEEAARRWREMSGRSGMLHTGHHVARITPSGTQELLRVATTKVFFADLTEAEIEAYVATGEPQRVAGGFTIDGFGGPFVSRVEGDPHNVVGISLPLLRAMLADLGIAWTDLWHR